MKLKFSAYHHTLTSSVSSNSKVSRIVFILFTVVYAAPRKVPVDNRTVLVIHLCNTDQAPSFVGQQISGAQQGCVELQVELSQQLD